VSCLTKEEQLEELRRKIAAEHLPLKEGHRLVFGKGNPDARIMFIGEAPGEKEDEKGVPFVGSAGKELDDLLGSIDLSIDDVYIANILKYRPPGNRDPVGEEIESHTPFLVDQIKIINPKVIVTLGNFATRFVLADFDCNKMDKVDGITKVHGKIKQVKLDDSVFLVMPTYHPAAILYNRSLRKEIEEDFVVLKNIVR
jgi:DNA polymerase